MAISIITIDGESYDVGASAGNVAFNNSGTGISAGTVQGAIEEVKLTPGDNITIEDGVISATGGGSQDSGMTPEQYAVVTGNVNTLQAKIDELIGKLANSSFSVFPKPTLVGELDWNGDGGGGGGTTTYNITQTLTNCTSSNTSSTITEGSTFTTTLSASSGYTLDGVTPTITMNGNPVSGAWDATSKVITIPNVSGNIAIGCTAVLAQQSYTVGYTLSHCTKSQNSSTSVVEGGSFNAVLFPDAGYTLNGVRATGNGFSQVYNNTNDSINIIGSNASGNISIVCTAATFQVSVLYNLTGFQSETNTQITSGGSFSKTLTPNTGYVVKSITVLMGGVDITATAWNASTRTVSIALVTGDISITALAEESTAHQITYGLTGIVVPATTQVEDGDPLSLTLQKDTDYSGWALLRPMKACDIIVYMGGNVLEQGTDYTATQSADDADITLNIASVTGNLVIMNVVWKHQYVFYADSSELGYIGGEVGGTAQRSAHSDNFIPIPDNCMQLAVMGANDTITSQYRWGCAVYDPSKTYINGAYLNNSEVAVSLLENGVRNNAKYIRTSAWLNFRNTESSEEYANRIDLCYIYDVTNDKFIWCGKDVDKGEVRENH